MKNPDHNEWDTKWGAVVLILGFSAVGLFFAANFIVLLAVHYGWAWHL